METEEVENLSLECEICGSKDYHAESGFYFCSVCQTQSQESRLFVEEEAYNPGFHARLAVLRSESATKKDRDLFERLTNWEVYNLVLKVFTDKLIEIGFPPILKDKVFQLYVCYLLKRKAILTINKHSAVTQSEPKQNVYALYGREPPKQVVRGPKRLAKLAKKEAIDSGEHDTTVSASIAKRRKTQTKRKAFEQEYVEHVNQNTETAPVDSYALDDVNQPPPKKAKKGQRDCPLNLTDGLLKVTREMREHVSTSTLHRNYVGRQNKVQTLLNRQIGSLLAAEQFSMRSALILLFVALRQIGCKVLMSDIIRMFHEGTLFVNSLRNFLSKEDVSRINLSSTDFLRCSIRCFNVAAFASPINVFLVYMGFKKFAIPKYKDLFPKFIEDLVLPNEFKYLVLQINKSFNLQDLSKTFLTRNVDQKYLPELSVLPAIIVILKLLFGLDDVTERYQSQFAKLVNQVIEDEQLNNDDTEPESEWDKLFVLEDWFSFIRYRETVTSLEVGSSISCNPSQLPNAKNVQNSMNKLRDEAVRIFGVSENNYRRLLAACDGAKSMFHQVCKDLNGGQELPNLPQYNSPNLPQQDITKTYIDSYPNVSHDHFNVDKLKQNFYRRRIDFVYNPDKYIPILNKAGYKVKLIKGDALHYKKKLVFKGKKIPLFQPYKSYDHAIGSHLNGTMSETMHFLLSLATSMVGGKESSETRILRERVEEFGNHFRGISFKINNAPEHC